MVATTRQDVLGADHVAVTVHQHDGHGEPLHLIRLDRPDGALTTPLRLAEPLVRHRELRAGRDGMDAVSSPNARWRGAKPHAPDGA